MHRRLGLAVLAGLLVALATVTGAWAGSSGGDGRHRAEVIGLLAKEVQSQDVDAAPVGQFGIGDRTVSSDDLYQGDKKVGFDTADCVLARTEPANATPETIKSASLQCVVTLSLKNGLITSQGVITFTGDPGASSSTARRPSGGEPSGQPSGFSFTFAITGGTGAYRTAHGELRGEEVAGQEGQLRITLRIIR